MRGWGPGAAGEGFSPPRGSRRAQRGSGTRAAGVGPRGLRLRGGAARPVVMDILYGFVDPRIRVAKEGA
jgi:hypothetical protein